MEHINNPFDSLDISYPRAKYGDGSIKQKAFFENGSYESGLVPIEERINILAKFVIAGYNLHELVNSYLDDKDALGDDRRKNDIAFTFDTYFYSLAETFDESERGRDNFKQLIGKCYSKNIPVKGESSSEMMKRRINEFVALVEEIYTERDFVEVPQVQSQPIFLIRTNLYDKDANNIERLVDSLYEDDIISINVRDRRGSDDEYFHKLFNRELEKHDSKKQYINQFYKLVNEAANTDVIVIAHYKGLNPKIGLIRKGSTYFCKEETGDIYKLYCLKMENVRCISSDDQKRFLSSLIPGILTISPVQRKRGVINSIYKDIPYPFELDSVSDSNLEKLCAEYLRSCLSYQSVRVLGKNFPDIDIIGYKNQNELFAAQVSCTANRMLIDKKKAQLCTFEEAKQKIMFSTLPTDENAYPLNINIQDVWNYFANNEVHKEFLKKLIEL